MHTDLREVADSLRAASVAVDAALYAVALHEGGVAVARSVAGHEPSRLSLEWDKMVEDSVGWITTAIVDNPGMHTKGRAKNRITSNKRGFKNVLGVRVDDAAMSAALGRDLVEERDGRLYPVTR